MWVKPTGLCNPYLKRVCREGMFSKFSGNLRLALVVESPESKENHGARHCPGYVTLVLGQHPPHSIELSLQGPGLLGQCLELGRMSQIN